MQTHENPLVGRCGIYCGACCIYRAQRDSPKLVEKLAAAFKTTPDKIRCNGCGDLTEGSWWIGCHVIECQDEKGYTYCFECPDFEADTCKQFKERAESYLEEDGVDMRRNMCLIRDGRIDEWLEESKRRYTCPHCGKPTIAGRKTCHHCEGDLESSG